LFPVGALAQTQTERQRRLALATSFGSQRGILVRYPIRGIFVGCCASALTDSKQYHYKQD
jgi:hypothetical protein